MLTIPALTLLFMAIVASLATAFVLMLWELEPRIARLQHRRDRAPRNRVG